MSDRKYRPVYMFIFTGLILMVIMMNYSFNLIYYIQNRIYENAVKTLFPVETYFEDNYDENSGSVWVDSEYVFGMTQDDKVPATQTDEGVVVKEVKKPTSRRNLDIAIDRLCTDLDEEPGRVKRLIAAVVVGQMLPDGAAKGGNALKIRFGKDVTRFSRDPTYCLRRLAT